MSWHITFKTIKQSFNRLLSLLYYNALGCQHQIEILVKVFFWALFLNNIVLFLGIHHFSGERIIFPENIPPFRKMHHFFAEYITFPENTASFRITAFHIILIIAGYNKTDKKNAPKISFQPKCLPHGHMGELRIKTHVYRKYILKKCRILKRPPKPASHRISTMRFPTLSFKTKTEPTASEARGFHLPLLSVIFFMLWENFPIPSIFLYALYENHLLYPARQLFRLTHGPRHLGLYIGALKI